jgi:hypothetical protein
MAQRRGVSGVGCGDEWTMGIAREMIWHQAGSGRAGLGWAELRSDADEMGWVGMGQEIRRYEPKRDRLDQDHGVERTLSVPCDSPMCSGPFQWST